ncbi:MAG: hypothetical protein OEO79_19255, partial [Gemmatimonadota bacterium]|nr:hypothetical protein [Gemmatimonadota bacterium]
MVKLGAELLAIGAGVFLGLLADDWRDLRIQRTAGLDALELVREDLRSDSAELAATRSGLLPRSELAPWLIRNQQERVAPDSAVTVVGLVLLLPRYQRIRPSYIALRETGRLDLIQNVEVRSEVVAYFERTQEQFVQELSDWLSVRELLIAELNKHFVISGSDTLRTVWPTPPDLTFGVDWPGLRSDRVTLSIVTRYSGL